MSVSFDPDRARHFDGPDLGANCLQRLTSSNQKTPLVGKEYTVLT